MAFTGFSPDTLQFLADLSVHNEREWFAENRARYESELLDRQKAFVEAIGAKFEEIDPRVAALPAVNKSIFRIYRDTRFSRDKSPYKTHADMIFWIGDVPKSSPGYYLRLSPGGLLVGAGAHLVAPDQDERYRAAVLDERGDALADILRDLAARGFEISEPSRKTVPRGFSASSRNAELLKHNEFHLVREMAEPPAELFEPAFVDWTMSRFQEVAPFVNWFAENVGDTHMEPTRARR